MDKKAVLQKLKADISTYNDFSEIKYKPKYVSVFEAVFGQGNHFTTAANNTSSGYGVKGCTEIMCGEISHEEFMRNIHEALLNLLDEAIDFLDMSADAEEHTGEDVVKNKIFIVHGHDEALKYQLSNWLREIELEPIILHEQANGGVTSILGKLERYSDVDCAIVLFTADDEGYEKGKPKERKLRARQNVVFEAGLFVGRLGAKRVIMLYDNGVEMPGDLGGCIYTEADKYGGWKEQLRKEFNAMGIEYKH